MSIDMVFKIAAIGILVAVLGQVLERTGREDMATLTGVAGLVIVLMMIIPAINELFSTIKSVFGLW